jgi:hypothetical protein
MRVNEIAVTMLERGYRTCMNAKAVRTAIGVAMRKGPYKQAGGKWAPV